jgi:hypothetical protein
MEKYVPLTKRAQVTSGPSERQFQPASSLGRTNGQADVQRRHARTFARQQKIAERVRDHRIGRGLDAAAEVDGTDSDRS